jgi:hypothetical protein
MAGGSVWITERRLGLAKQLAGCFPDDRNPSEILHARTDMIRARMRASPAT